MKVFVDKRLCEPPDCDQHLALKSPIRKNKAKTLYVKLCNFPRAIKTLSKWIGTFDKGSLQLTLPYGSLHSTNKSVLVNILTEQAPAKVTLDDSSCLLIDGQALVMALGKPPGIITFGEYANMFAGAVL